MDAIRIIREKPKKKVTESNRFFGWNGRRELRNRFAFLTEKVPPGYFFLRSSPLEFDPLILIKTKK